MFRGRQLPLFNVKQGTRIIKVTASKAKSFPCEISARFNRGSACKLVVNWKPPPAFVTSAQLPVRVLQEALSRFDYVLIINGLVLATFSA
jgi:hypothetical protein